MCLDSVSRSASGFIETRGFADHAIRRELPGDFRVWCARNAMCGCAVQAIEEEWAGLTPTGLPAHMPVNADLTPGNYKSLLDPRSDA